MIRYLAQVPADVDETVARCATLEAFPAAVDANEVHDESGRYSAVYFDDERCPTASAVAAWQKTVARLVDAPSVDPLQAAKQIIERKVNADQADPTAAELSTALAQIAAAQLGITGS